MAVSTSNASRLRAIPKSAHVADPSLQPFLQHDFDPANYLNNALPPLSTSTNSSRTAQGGPASLMELSTQSQSLFAQLNAQTTRLSNALTQLTDEILRSGGRLAYEVEVLRGETSGLTDALDKGLRSEIDLLAPQQNATSIQRDATQGNANDTTIDTHEDKNQESPAKGVAAEPAFLDNLQTLTAIRARLDSVVKVFGDAMAWPIAPSEVASLSSSIISISAPESTEASKNRETKAKQYAETLRLEIDSMLDSENEAGGLEAAVARVDELKMLAEIWKGTAEEKARSKFVETFSRHVEERRNVLERAGKKAGGTSVGLTDYRYGNMDTRATGDGGYGFLQNLRNLKNDMYLE